MLSCESKHLPLIVIKFPVIIVILVFEVFVVSASSAQPMTIADATVRSQLYKLSVLKDRHEAHVIQVITEFIVGNVNVICKRTRKYERL